MKYAVSFFAFAGALVYLAWRHGGWAWLLLWPAVGFAIVACGYAFLGPGVMGKNASGRVAWWSVIVLLPFRVFVYSAWWTQKTLSREAVYAEIAPGIWMGRRASLGEMPAGTGLVIDLTSELIDPRAVRAGTCQYICVPTLDASAPNVESVRAALDQVLAATTPVYIHCAQGHGRAGAFAAALLIRRGTARNVDDAIQLLREVRPAVDLSARQRRFVESISS